MSDNPLTPEGRALYRGMLLDDDLMSLREQFARVTAEQLGNVASWLGFDSLLGAGDIDTSTPSDEATAPERYAAFRGVSAVVEMASELAMGCVSMLDSGHRYAAAALIRQLIECEYLLHAFVEDLSRAASWYRASPSEIRSAFMPKTMRPLGGFSDREYWTHCDQGGHPSPQGRVLLRFGGHGDPADEGFMAASMWGDLAQHLGRVWWAAHDLLSTHHARFVDVRASQIAVVDAIGARWRDADPLSRPVDFSLVNQLASGGLDSEDGAS